MASSYQKAAFRRKRNYLLLLAGLFAISLLMRGVIVGANGSIDKQAERLDLTEASQGDVELSGSALRVMLTGSRGLAVCILWSSATDKQKRQDWNDLELLVNSITKLQPHSITPWLFQSWNLTYNVSVELERLNDAYFYIAKGIRLIARGIELNNHNPDLRYSTALYYQSKFGVADKVDTFRCLYALSCIPPDQRRAADFLAADKSVKTAEVEKFTREYPQLVRRLRESKVALAAPADLVRFLNDNNEIPARYVVDDKQFKLASRLAQFPVLPPPEQSGREDDPQANTDIGDGHQDAFFAARAWFRYSLAVIPPPSDQPGGVPEVYDRSKYRIPKLPMVIIFRQGTPRAQTYIADRLQSEGWIDNSKWLPDAGFTGDERWFGGQTVEIAPSMTSEEAWSKAYSMWEDHGKKTGLIKTPEELAAYAAAGQLAAQRRGMSQAGQSIIDLSPDEVKAAADARKKLNDGVALSSDEIAAVELARSKEANNELFYYGMNRRVTNFEDFLVTSRAESSPLVLKAREVSRKASRAYKPPFSDRIAAIGYYEEAFPLWKKVLNDPAFREFAGSDKLQESLFEMQRDYQNRVVAGDESQRREATQELFDMLRRGGGAVTGASWLVPLERELFVKLLPDLQSAPPLLPDGPFDVKIGQPEFIREDIRKRVESRLSPPTSANPPPSTPAPAP